MSIIRWIKEGRIRAYKTPGGHRRIMRGDLEDFCRRAGIPVQAEEHLNAEAPARVLIVDDDPSVVDSILDAILDDSGDAEAAAFEVAQADNLFDAGRLLVSFRPDLIFLDMDLPSMNACSVVQGIRDDPAVPGIWIVGVTHDLKAETGTFDELLRRPFAKTQVRRITGPLPKLDLPKRPEK